MSRHAFTLVELLVVMAIIAVLTAMVLAAAGVVRESARRSRTETILAAALQGVHTWAAEHGGLPSPAEHPLAGSKTPRAVFLRAAGGPVATTGMALIGVEEANLAVGAQDRLLLADDRFAGDDALRAPALFGVRRDRLGVLGAGIADVSACRLLPTPAAMGAIIASPDTVGRLIQPSEGVSAIDKLLRAILGRGGQYDELARIGALWSPPDDANLAWNGRVWSATKAGATVPGTAMLTDTDGTQRYRLRGPAIYDAWGNEVLYSISADGRNPRFESAGRDGFFAWSPGADGVFQTDARADAPTGDDRAASSDNVIAGAR